MREPRHLTDYPPKVQARIKRDVRMYRDYGPNGCMVWSRPVKVGHYPYINGGTKHHQMSMKVARVVWEIAHGPIPAGMFVCHRCDNPRCVKLDHLFLGTPLENTRDMMAKGRASHGKYKLAWTHCPKGHPYEGENVRRREHGWRECVACRRERQARRASRLRVKSTSPIRRTPVNPNCPISATS